MKKTLLSVCVYLVCTNMYGQLKRTTSCPTFTVDVLDGKINGLRITDNVAQFKSKFPCFTAAENDSPGAKCGGGIFFKDKDIYVYTARDYIEIGPKFKGKLSVPLMGASRGGLFRTLGHPKIKEAKWDAFSTAYGILILYYNSANRVNKIQMSTENEETIQLCQ